MRKSKNSSVDKALKLIKDSNRYGERKPPMPRPHVVESKKRYNRAEFKKAARCW